MCLDCGAELHGEYCHACGQRDVDPKASIWHVLGEFIAESLELDGRLPRTLVPFLLRPGLLAHEFMQGRRRRYTSPVRLYVFAALVSFFLLQTAVGLAIEGEDVVITTDGVKVDSSHTLPPAQEDGADELDTPAADTGDEDTDTALIPDRYRGLPKDALARTLIRDVFGWAPMGAAVLLFAYAFLLELFYRRVPFLTHLVASTHVHAFALLVLGAAAATRQGVALPIALGVVQLYVFVGLRKTYAEGWIKTILKHVVLTVLYTTLFALAVAGVFLAATQFG